MREVEKELGRDTDIPDMKNPHLALIRVPVHLLCQSQWRNVRRRRRKKTPLWLLTELHRSCLSKPVRPATKGTVSFQPMYSLRRLEEHTCRFQSQPAPSNEQVASEALACYKAQREVAVFCLCHFRPLIEYIITTCA